MPARIHIHIHSDDLAKSKDFYEKFFGVKPVKDLADYVKFLPDFAPVNLAISGGSLEAEGARQVSHVGVQLDSSEEVFEQMQRVKATGLKVRDEISVNCCHANQDKFWVRDPSGIDWEVYHLNYDLDPIEEKKMGMAKRGKLIGLTTMAPAAGCCPTPPARSRTERHETHA
ncbi:MAG: glyoxalase/bleomycin resistance/dioxygenase family protein [Chloroflexi bacterium]|nr:glyoxalase/bleomycin resistance/dioxygenase family protein [Chloroflexota bacterium]